MKPEASQFLIESNLIEGIEVQESNLLDMVGVHAQNSVRAWNYVQERIKSPLTIKDVFALHELQMQSLLPTEQLGVIRSRPVWLRKRAANAAWFADPSQPMFIDRYIPVAKHGEIEKHLAEFVKMWNSSCGPYHLEQHYYFECIHPFIDGNGRVGRLLWAWKILQEEGAIYSMLNLFQGRSNAFYDKREEYYDALTLYKNSLFPKGDLYADGQIQYGLSGAPRKPKRRGSSTDAANAKPNKRPAKNGKRKVKRGAKAPSSKK